MSKELPSGLKLLTLWALIILVVFLGFQAWERERRQSRVELNAGGQIVLQRGADGHFHWPGRVNGVVVDFLVDTGATTTALPESLARAAGLQPEAQVSSSTAGGIAVGYRARADLELSGGITASRLAVTVLPQLGSPLLGMDVLSKLRFTQQAGELRIEPAAQP